MTNVRARSTFSNRAALERQLAGPRVPLVTSVAIPMDDRSHCYGCGDFAATADGVGRAQIAGGQFHPVPLDLAVRRGRINPQTALQGSISPGRATVSIAGYLKYTYLAYFSKPTADRALYREVRRRRASKTLLIGLATPARALRLMQVAANTAEGREIHFAAIDLFEARPAERPGMGLKDAFRQLKVSGQKVQLIPGDPQSALVRSANALGQMDLVLISSEHDETSIGGGWFYVPRMLHANSRVYQESLDERGQPRWRLLLPPEIERMATAHRPRRAA